MIDADNMPMDVSQRRLLWRCRRGMLELDLLLTDFIYYGYGNLDEPERQILNDLLDYPDAVLLDLLMGKAVAADQGVASVIKKIRSIDTSAAT